MNIKKQNILIKEHETIIIGAGLTGLIAGALLKKEHLDFVILESTDEVGGTWQWTDYPGAGTDTEVMTYFPTFARAKTKYKFATRNEIFDYCISFSNEYIGREYIHFNTKVENIHYHSLEMKWHINTNHGVYKARYIVHATAGINIPKAITFPGKELFKGRILHSSEVKSDLNFFKNKHVCIIGLGATTVQLAPSILKTANTVTVFRRSLPYILKYQRKVVTQNNMLYQLYRILLEGRNDFYSLFDGLRQFEFIIRWPIWFKEYFFVRKRTPAIVPPISQPLHCTRRCFDYLGFRHAIENNQIEIVDTSQHGGISGINTQGVVVQGKVWKADIIICATGYEIGRINHPILVDDQLIALSPDLSYKFNTFRELPNFFMPLVGGPLFTIPPRLTQDHIPYFIKLVKYMQAHHYKEFRLSEATALKAKNINDQIFRLQKKTSVVFSPACNSFRYLISKNLTPDQKGHYINAVNESSTRNLQRLQSAPIPRCILKLLMYFGFKMNLFTFRSE